MRYKNSPILLILMLTTISCNTDEPHLSITTCDLLENPNIYANKIMEFHGNVKRNKYNRYEFETYCDKISNQRISVEWADRKYWDFQYDFARERGYNFLNYNTVVGKLIRKPNGTWYIEAKDYYEAIYYK